MLRINRCHLYQEETENFVTESESPLDELSSETLVGPKDVNLTTDITDSTTDIKVITGESKSDAFQGGWLKPPKKTRFFQPATRMSIGPKYARTRQKSMIGTPFRPKKQESNEVDGNRANYLKRISEPILLENSLGWI